jgi:dTDP-4-dehydrorhamnose reductase
MRILLTGGGGQVGFELERSLAVLGDLHVLDRRSCDLADELAIRNIVRSARPDVIVNAAAYTMVDRAESESEIAWQINARAPRVLAEEADGLGALLVHYSTDYVFDGTKSDEYIELDAPHPVNVYGSTKLQGEVAIAAATRRHLILRTSWVLGAHGANFAKTIIRLAAERPELKVVCDQTGTPTSAALLADATAHVVRRYVVDGQGDPGFPFGLYHLVASGYTTWYEYARFVVSEAQKLGVELRITPDSIRAITTPEYPTPARRPMNSRMSSGKFTGAFGLRIPPWQDGVSHVLRQIY